MASNYIIAGRQPWNRDHFHRLIEGLGDNWVFCDSTDELIAATSGELEFRYIFFLHWSHRVPDRILERFECVCFHMTDVPYGRGGSPLQNLISLGHRETVVTALRMTPEFDAGPVYMKKNFSLEGSTAEEIYQRASLLSCRMAIDISSSEPEPEIQTGPPTVFKRRTAADSQLFGDQNDLLAVFDHIRMLDADGYPRAFLEVGDFRLEFSRAGLYHDEVRADVRISMKNKRQHS